MKALSLVRAIRRQAHRHSIGTSFTITKILQDSHNNFDKILKLEAQLLVKMPSLKKDEINSHIEQHNSQVGEIAYKIDKQVYQLLNPSEEQVAITEENLRFNGIHLPKSVPN